MSPLHLYKEEGQNRKNNNRVPITLERFHRSRFISYSRKSFGGAFPSNDSSFERSMISGSGPYHHSYTAQLKNPLANPPLSSEYQRKISNLSIAESHKQRKISEESRASQGSHRSRLTLEEFMGQSQISDKTSFSRKTTPTESIRSGSKISLETTSLADFLKALDTVHSRLNSTTRSSIDMSSGGMTGSFNLTTGAPIRKSQRDGRRPTLTDRRRKVGVFGPSNFAYLNAGFVTGKEDEKDGDRKESSEDNNTKRK
jgi:hypothetical protein